MASTSWFPIHLTGLTMVIDGMRVPHRTLVASLLTAAVMGTTAVFAAPIAAPMGVVDARQPDAANAVWAAAQPTGTGPWGYFQLSDPSVKVLECCIQLGKGTETNTMQYQGDEATTVSAAQSVHFTPPLDQGFVGLLLDKDAKVRRVNPHRIVVRYPHLKQQVRVDHCVSSEGMHVKMTTLRGNQRAGDALHYYVPLGADVEPDCPAKGL